MTVLLMAGDQLPLMPFKDVVGKGGIVVPAQTAVGTAKFGTWLAVITTVAVAVTPAHPPAAAMV